MRLLRVYPFRTHRIVVDWLAVVAVTFSVVVLLLASWSAFAGDNKFIHPTSRAHVVARWQTEFGQVESTGASCVAARVALLRLLEAREKSVVYVADGECADMAVFNGQVQTIALKRIEVGKVTVIGVRMMLSEGGFR